LYPNFFDWLSLAKTETIEKFNKGFEDNIRILMETMHQPWSDIQKMTYPFFLKTIEWKTQLEEKKKEALSNKKQHKVDGNRDLTLRGLTIGPS